MERRENLRCQSLAIAMFDMSCGHVDDVSLHGRQRRTTPLMGRRMDGSQYTSFCPKPPVPAFLIKVDVLAIEFVEEARVANVQLVWRNADDWACPICQPCIMTGTRILAWYSP
jgi:hypothetical protein